MSNVAPNRTLLLANPAPASTPTATTLLAPPSRPSQTPKPVKLVPTWATPPEPERLVMLGSQSPEAASALRVVRHRLEQRRAEGMHVVAVTSARSREGKTTLATQLALCLSEADRARVLLVEANFVKPTMASLLGFTVAEGEGFSAQLARRMQGGREPWVLHALGPSLHLLAEGSSGSFPEALHSVYFASAINQLSHGYDYVLIDAPSVLDSGDVHVIEGCADAVVLAARSGTSRSSELRAAVRQLGERKIAGVVLWDCDGPANRGN